MKNIVYVFAVALLVYSCGKSVLDKVKKLDTPYLISSTVPVYYSLGYEKKAKQIQEDWVKCVYYFKTKINTNVSPVYLALLDDKDFEKLSVSYSYGFPWFSKELDKPAVVFLPANDKGVIAKENKNIIKNADTSITNQIKALWFDMDKAIDKSVDLIGYHELGHLYSMKLNIQKKIKNIYWLKEFIASYIAYCYMYENDSSSALLTELIGKVVISSWHPTTTDLAEMGNYHKDAQVYGWFEAKLMLKAAEIYKQHKLTLITTLQLQNNENDMVLKLSELANQDVNKW